jgi:hypothetical protein
MRGGVFKFYQINYCGVLTSTLGNRLACPRLAEKAAE